MTGARTALSARCSLAKEKNLADKAVRAPVLPMPNVALAVAEPTTRRDFLLGEELHAFFALHVEIAEK